MLPGFTAMSALEPSVALAVWEVPKGECRPIGTDTFCTALVMWCKDVYFCPGGSSPAFWNGVLVGFGRIETRDPYPCGVCVGISSPDDW